MRTKIAVPMLLVLVGGCALTSKSDPTQARYFSPERAHPAHAGEPRTGLQLRLGRVNASEYIKDKILHRDSLYEVGSYEERRWTEKPEAYVRRALSLALFERRGLQRVVSGDALALEVDLLALEEVRGGSPVGRVRLAFTVRDDRVVLLSDEVTVERPIAADTRDPAEAVVRALADALDVAVETVADRVAGEVRSQARGT